MQTERIEELIGIVLNREFKSDPQKTRIYRAGNRLNFSCPYCGDSSDPRKKRGNFYLDTLGYKCYNGGCGVYKDMIGFFRDFSLYNRLSSDEVGEVMSILDENKIRRKGIYGKIDIGLFFENDITDVLIPRQDLMEKLNLIEVRDSRIERYVLRRGQKLDNRFAWDDAKEKLFLFNLTPEDKIIGLQVRNMKSGSGISKYLTYKLSGIYSKLLKETNEKILEKSSMVDPISHVFGIGFLDFSYSITIFEGPMDSWFWPNSVGLCSLENKFPFDVENIKYWYDWDDSGNKKTMHLLSQGHTVFNWGKFLDEHQITKNRKWDLNDLVMHLRSTGKKIKRFENYFTNDVLDLRYFIDE